MDCTGGIEVNIAANSDSSFVRPRQPSNTVKQCGFAGAGSSKQNRDAGRNFDGNIEDKRIGSGAAPLLAATAAGSLARMSERLLHLAPQKRQAIFDRLPQTTR